MPMCNRKFFFKVPDIEEDVGIVFSNDTLADDDTVKLTEVVRIAILDCCRTHLVLDNSKKSLQ